MHACIPRRTPLNQPQSKLPNSSNDRQTKNKRTAFVTNEQTANLTPPGLTKNDNNKTEQREGASERESDGQRDSVEAI